MRYSEIVSMRVDTLKESALCTSGLFISTQLYLEHLEKIRKFQGSNTRNNQNIYGTAVFDTG